MDRTVRGELPNMATPSWRQPERLYLTRSLDGEEDLGSRSGSSRGLGNVVAF